MIRVKRSKLQATDRIRVILTNEETKAKEVKTLRAYKNEITFEGLKAGKYTIQVGMSIVSFTNKMMYKSKQEVIEYNQEEQEFQVFWNKKKNMISRYFSPSEFYEVTKIN